MEKFDPKDEQYKEVADLPPEHQEEFMDVKGGGFVSREAIINIERAEEMAHTYEKWLKELDKLLGAENFKPQKAEWVDDEHIEILFKKGNETAIFDVKIERGLGRTWCNISYPNGGSSFTMTDKSVDEVLREIEHKFGVTVPPKK